MAELSIEEQLKDPNSELYKKYANESPVLDSVTDFGSQLLSDTDDVVRKGFVGSINEIFSDTANNLNSLWDAGGDFLFGEGDYRSEYLDDAIKFYEDTFVPPQPQTVAGRTTKAVTKPIATFLATRRVLPVQWGVGRDIAAEGGASLLRDNYAESLAHLGQEMGPEFMKPIFDYIAVKEDDPIVVAMIKRSIEDVTTASMAEAFIGGLKAYKGIKYSDNIEQATKAENKGKKDIDKAVQSAKQTDEVVQETTEEAVQEGAEKSTKVTLVDSPKASLDMTEFDVKDLTEKLASGQIDDVGQEYFNRNRLGFKNRDDLVGIVNTFENAISGAVNANVKIKERHEDLAKESMDLLNLYGVQGLTALVKKKTRDVDQMSSLMVATRYAVHWFADEYDQVTKVIARGSDDMTNMQALARMHELEEMMPSFGELGVAGKRLQASAARTTASGNIVTRRPDNELRFLNDAQLAEQLNKLGSNHIKKLKAKAKRVQEASMRSGQFGGRNTLTKEARFKILKIARTNTFNTRLQHFLSERFRRNILFNVPTIGLNATMGIFETFARPLSEYLGSIATPTALSKERRQARKEILRHMIGLKYSVGIARRQAIKALKNNKAILDPHVTATEGVLDRGSAEYLLGSNKYTSKLLEAPMGVGWFTRTAINMSGYLGTLSYRALNATDEFIKDLNYYARAYAIAGEELLDKGASKKEVQQKLYSLFSDDGEALGKSYVQQQSIDDVMMTSTRERSLQYSREVTYTDDNNFTNAFRELSTGFGYMPGMQIIFPFVRTPTQIISKGIRMTPPGALYNIKQLTSDNIDVRTRALGELAATMSILSSFSFAALEGKITGPGPSDPRLAKLWRQEHQPYSIKIDGQWYDYGRYSPWSIPIKAVAAWTDAIKYDELGTDAEDWFHGMAISMMSIIRDEGTLRGLEHVAEVIDDPVYKLDNFITDVMASTFNPLGGKAPSQLFSFLGEEPEGVQLARTFEEKLLKNMGAKTYTAYNWVTGQPQEPTEYLWFPYSKQKKPTESDVVAEIVRLGNPALSEGISRTIEGEKLTSKQISQYQKILGTTKIANMTIEQALRKKMNTKEYKSTGSDMFKAAQLQEIKSKFKKQAEMEFFKRNPILGTKILRIRGGNRIEKQSGISLFPTLRK